MQRIVEAVQTSEIVEAKRIVITLRTHKGQLRKSNFFIAGRIEGAIQAERLPCEPDTLSLVDVKTECCLVARPRISDRDTAIQQSVCSRFQVHPICRRRSVRHEQSQRWPIYLQSPPPIERRHVVVADISSVEFSHSPNALRWGLDRRAENWVVNSVRQ